MWKVNESLVTATGAAFSDTPLTGLGSRSQPVYISLTRLIFLTLTGTLMKCDRQNTGTARLMVISGAARGWLHRLYDCASSSAWRMR
ncbi:MAG: hypothetical protein ROW52_03560 [Anaerolineaceae bacterium]|jgi:hypothetical protein